MFDEASFHIFKERVRQLTGIDLNSYKERQMKRRIDSLITRHGCGSYDSYLATLQSDQKVYHEFLDRLTINVSEFFRNSSRWEVLETKILPSLSRTQKELRVWSAACSTGEEPYSLAILLDQAKLLPATYLLATDIDTNVLHKAQQGRYPYKSVTSIPQEYRSQYLDKVGDDYIINSKLRQSISFKHHDLLKDRYEQSFDLIVCRNVLIYFTDEAKDLIYRRFNLALKPGGVLFVGSTEQIFNARELGFTSIDSFFYQKS